MFGKTFKKLAVAGLVCCCLIEDYNVQSCYLVMVMPKRLPDHPFEPVAVDCKPAVFLCYGEAQPRLLHTVVAIQNRKQLIIASPGLPEYAAIGRRVQQPALPRKSLADRLGVPRVVVDRSRNVIVLLSGIGARVKAEHGLLLGGASG